MPAGDSTFRALTGLRFLAAAHVVWFHAGPATGIPALDRVRDAGWTAVNLFFVLSGFVLAHRYPRLEGPGAVRGFLAARAARIYPAHLLALAGTLLALVTTGALAGFITKMIGREGAADILLLSSARRLGASGRHANSMLHHS